MQTYGRLDRDVLVAGAWWVGSLDLACQGLFLLLVVDKLCLDSCNPMDGRWPGSSVHGIPQARILEWIAMPSFQGFSLPKEGTLLSYVSCIAAAAAAKSLQSCPTLCDPIDGSSPGSPVPGIPQARTLEWVAISFSNAGK